MEEDEMTEDTTETPPAVPPIATPRPPAATAAPAAPVEEAPRVQGRGGPMTDEAVKERVARGNRTMLKQLGLPSDPEEAARVLAGLREKDTILQQKDEEIKTFRTKEEEAERAKMSDLERLQTDLAAANAEIAQLKTLLSEQKTSVLMEKQRSKVVELASKYKVMPKWTDTMFQALVSHYNALTRKDQLTFTPVMVDRWARAWVRERPEVLEKPSHAGTAVETPGTNGTEAASAAHRPAAPAVRRPIGAKRPPPPPQRAAATHQRGVNTTGKDVMKMTSKELDAYMQSTLGLKKTW